MFSLIQQMGIVDFILVSIILGGGAAYLTGRAVARGWEPVTRALAWMVPLTCAVRFIHFALFHGTLISPELWLMDFVILAIAAVIGHRVTRFRQMTRNYAWTIEPAGLLSWKLRR